MSEETKSLIGGTSTGGGSRKLFTGFADFNVVAVNPTSKEFNDIVGYERDMDYSPREFSDSKFSVVRFLLHNEKVGYVTKDILIGNQPITNADGNKFRFVDTKGQMSFYATDTEEVLKKASFHTPQMRKMMSGENTLFEFLQSLVNYYSGNDNANFLGDMEGLGYSPENIFNGQIQSLKTIVEGYSNNTVTCLCSVRSTEKGSYQDVERYFYPNKSRAVKDLDEYNRNRIKNDYTIEFQEYSPEAHTAPTENMSQGSAGKAPF